MFDKVKQLMEMKKQADRIRRELDALSVEVNEGNGIKIAVTGSQDFRSIELDENLMRIENKKKLEAELLRSLNAAIHASQRLAAQKMKSILPGGFPGN